METEAEARPACYYYPFLRIDGSHVLFTGASSGIGAALAVELTRRGAKVAGVSRRGDVRADLADAAERKRAYDEVLARLGRVDILINNAGVGLYEPSWRASDQLVRRMFEVNFFAALDFTQHAVPAMRQRGSGLIVNVASIASKVTLPWFTLYSASKAALESFTRGLRIELRGSGVGAMLVCPGYVKTQFQASVLAGNVPPKLAHSKQFASTPENVARAVADGVERGARTVLVPAVMGWGFVAASKVAPDLIDARMAAMMEDGDD